MSMIERSWKIWRIIPPFRFLCRWPYRRVFVINSSKVKQKGGRNSLLLGIEIKEEILQGERKLRLAATRANAYLSPGWRQADRLGGIPESTPPPAQSCSFNLFYSSYCKYGMLEIHAWLSYHLHPSSPRLFIVPPPASCSSHVCHFIF